MIRISFLLLATLLWKVQCINAADIVNILIACSMPIEKMLYRVCESKWLLGVEGSMVPSDFMKVGHLSFINQFSFQKCNIGWPQQHPTEKVLKFNSDKSRFYQNHFFQNIKIKLWHGSSKIQFCTDIWYPSCWRLLRPVYVTFLKTGWWNSNVQTSWSH